jgi:glycosyltransferase involved in cell wall biosynthesis
MKIAIVAEPYVAVPPAKYGGTERVIYYLIKGLLERGHEIILLATGDSSIAEELKNNNKFELIPIVDKHTFFGKDKEEQKEIEKKVSKIHIKMRSILNKLKPKIDIIHSQGFDLRQFQDFPNLTTLHGPFIFSQIRYFEHRKGLFYASISENQQAGFPDLQYVGICYNGLNPEDFPFVPSPENFLCFIGRFDEEKQPHLAIELALKLNMKIKVAGKLDWQGKEYFEEKIKPHFSNPLVEYLGELGATDKVKLISNASVNLHPTGFREPFGLTVLEAAYCGTPTLAISHGSMPELIEDGRTGLLVEDFVEGYHHIEDLLKMDRKYISERSRNLFNYKTMSRQYEIAYEKVIEIFNERKFLSAKTLKEMQNMRDILRGVWREK